MREMPQAGPDGRPGGVDPGDDHQGDRAEDVLVAEALAVDLHFEQMADQVAAEHRGHGDLGRGLVVGPAELHVDAFVEVGVDLTGDGAQAGGVEIGEIDEVGPLDRGGGGEVEVVTDQHRRARRPLGVEPAATVREHDRRHSCGLGGADAVHDRPHPAALVEVGARAEHQRTTAGVPDGDRAHAPGVPLDRGAVKAGYLVVVDRCDGLPDEVGGPSPARAEHQRDVVAFGAGALGDHGGGRGSDGERIGGRVAEVAQVMG